MTEKTTKRQRQYLLDLGVPKRSIPPTKSEASELIDRILADRRREQLGEYLPEGPAPESIPDQYQLLEVCEFVELCALKRFGSRHCILPAEIGRIGWGIMQDILASEDKVSEQEEKIEELPENRDELQHEESELETRLEENPGDAKLSEKLSKQTAQVQKAQSRLENGEERLDKLMEKVDWYVDELGNLDIEYSSAADEDGLEVPATDNKLKNRIYKEFKTCVVQVEWARKSVPESFQTNGEIRGSALPAKAKGRRKKQVEEAGCVVLLAAIVCTLATFVLVTLKVLEWPTR